MRDIKQSTYNKRRNLVYLLLVISLLTLTACAADPGTGNTTTEPGETERTFTLQELAQFDGQDGRAAYIAVDGVVYDVTDIPQWSGGIHQGRFPAGMDYSEEIRSESPHGTSMLSRAEVVGVLVD